MTGARLGFQLTLIQALAWFKRLLHVLMRTTWSAGVGYLAGWGIYTLYGWEPDLRIWYALAILLGLISLSGLVGLPGRARLVWSLDRIFGLKEQVSTAWQVSRSRRGLSAGSPGQTNSIETGLIADTNALLPHIFSRLLLRGWWIIPDLLSLALVAAMAVTAASAQTITLPSTSPMQALPPLQEDPSFKDIFPNGLPNQEAAQKKPEDKASSTQNQPGGDPGNNGSPNALTPQQKDMMDQTMKMLGDQLSQQAPLYDVGQSLKQGDLQGASKALDNLADQAAGLSKDARESVSKTLDQIGNQMEQMKMEPLAQDMKSATSALTNPEENPAESIARVAKDLREIGQQMAAGGDNSGSPASGTPGEKSQPGGITDNMGDGGSGSGTGALSLLPPKQGQPDPLRLAGEGGNLELPPLENTNSGLLVPALPGQNPGTETAHGTGNVPAGIPGTNPGADIPTPYYYSWSWRDVVSQYFSH